MPRHKYSGHLTTTVSAIVALTLAMSVTLGTRLTLHAVSTSSWMNILNSRTGGKTENDNRDILRTIFRSQPATTHRAVQKKTFPQGRARPRQLPKREGDKWREEEPLRPSGTLQVPDDTSED
ncbi:MAG: hypothetical protein HOO67_03545 [Candidatus Peribacteraceae bacterium]|nr:hypothetical protein [Candidatus Peribacteraceae bacterium]